MTAYLNLPEVQSALHVHNVPAQWSMCNNEMFSAWPESDWRTHMEYYYQEILEETSAAGLPFKILVFTGDDDSVCGTHGTQYWIDRMEGWTPITSSYSQAWPDTDLQVGGFLSVYEVDVSDGVADADEGGDEEEHEIEKAVLYLSTVHSAGHMAPQTQPSKSLTLLKKFLYEMK